MPLALDVVLSPRQTQASRQPSKVSAVTSSTLQARKPGPREDKGCARWGTGGRWPGVTQSPAWLQAPRAFPPHFVSGPEVLVALTPASRLAPNPADFFLLLMHFTQLCFSLPPRSPQKILDPHCSQAPCTSLQNQLSGNATICLPNRSAPFKGSLCLRGEGQAPEGPCLSRAKPWDHLSLHRSLAPPRPPARPCFLFPPSNASSASPGTVRILYPSLLSTAQICGWILNRGPVTGRELEQKNAAEEVSSER